MYPLNPYIKHFDETSFKEGIGNEFREDMLSEVLSALGTQKG